MPTLQIINPLKKQLRGFIKIPPYFYSIPFFLLLPCFKLRAQSSQKTLSPGNVSLADTAMVLLYDSMANAALKFPDTAQCYVSYGMEIAQKIHYSKGIAMLINDQALVYMKEKKDDKALAEFSKAVVQFSALGLIGPIGRIYRDMALVNLYKAEHEKAMALVLKALHIFESRHMELDIPFCYSIMGYINVQQGNLKDGIKNHRESYNLEIQLLKNNRFRTVAEKTHLISNYIQSCLNLGNVYTRKKDYVNSLIYLQKGLEASQSWEYMNIHIKLLISMALAYSNIKENKKAECMLRKALKLAMANKMYYEQSVAYANLASLFVDCKTGLSYYDSAMDLARNKVNDVMLVINVLKSKSGYASDKRNYKAALEASEMYHALNDSIFSVQKAVAIKDLESTNLLSKTKVVMQQMELRDLKSRQTVYFTGIISFVLVVALIITMAYQAKLKKLHENVLRQREILQKLNESKDKFFSVISHDLKSPLTAVAGILYLMKTDGLDANKRESYLTKLIRQNDNALDIMNKLLAWGSFEIRNEQVQKTFIAREELKSTLQAIVDLAAEKNITFLEKLNQTSQLTTNPYHFEFIIRNLLQNAIKFTPPGGKVQIEYCKEGDSNVFSIIDNGTGIPQHIAHKLYQTAVESSSGTKGEKGIGIGLMLVKKYADMNGYQLKVISNPSSGTVFKVYL